MTSSHSAGRGTPWPSGCGWTTPRTTSTWGERTCLHRRLSSGSSCGLLMIGADLIASVTTFGMVGEVIPCWWVYVCVWSHSFHIVLYPSSPHTAEHRPASVIPAQFLFFFPLFFPFSSWISLRMMSSPKTVCVCVCVFKKSSGWSGEVARWHKWVRWENLALKSHLEKSSDWFQIIWSDTSKIPPCSLGTRRHMLFIKKKSIQNTNCWTVFLTWIGYAERFCLFASFPLLEGS